MESAAMKILYVGVIAVLASTTTAASLRTLPEVKEFIFEYDSESEDTPQREVGSIRKPDVGLNTGLSRPASHVWSQLDKVVQKLAIHLITGTDQSGDILVPGNHDRETTHPSDYHPIRFTIDYSSLDLLPLTSLENALKVVAIKNQIMPRVLQTWQDVVYVQPLGEPLDLSARSGGTSRRCFGTPLPQDPVHETDYLLVVDGENDDSYPCRLGNIAAYAGPCVFDEDRLNPRAGKITFCLERMDTIGNAIPLEDVDTTVSGGIEELGRALGLSPDFLPFYINPKTNSPYGFGPPGSHKCVASDSSMPRLPANVQMGGDADNDHPFYEIRAPILSRVIQNQMNRPITSGARLEMQHTYGGTIGRCIGNDLEERHLVNNLIHNDTTQRIHITTLAWLEETGWYKVDYGKAAPELRCPALCSGRGTCDWSGNTTTCICDNREDSTPGCFGSFRELSHTGFRTSVQQTPGLPLPTTETSSFRTLPTSIKSSFVRRQLLLNTMSAPTALDNVDDKVAEASDGTLIEGNNAGWKQQDPKGDSEIGIVERGEGREQLIDSNQMAGANVNNKAGTKQTMLRVIKVDDLD